MERAQGGTSKGTSESIFASLNFDPQLFINDVRNAVDDEIDGGFDFFREQAPKILGVKEEEISKGLSEAIDGVQYTVQLKLNRQLDIWEKYCTLNCFAIPEGLSFPQVNSTKNGLSESPLEHRLSDMELDSELESLREKLVAAGRESAELRRELSTLERQAAVAQQHVEALNDALVPLEENSTHDVMKEIIKATSVLREKMEQLKIERRDKMENLRIERIRSPNIINTKRKDIPGFEASIEDLQNFEKYFKGIIQS